MLRLSLRAARSACRDRRCEGRFVDYDLHQGVEDADAFFFYENWESGEDLDAHLAAPHLRELAARIPELLDENGLTVNRVRRIARSRRLGMCRRTPGFRGM